MKNPNQNPKKILIAVGFQPYPTLFGGAVDVWERIIGLVSLGHVVDLVFSEKNFPSTDDLHSIENVVNKVYFVKRRNNWKQLFSNQPLQVLSRTGFSSVSFSSNYDLVIAEGEFCVSIIDNNSLVYDKLIIRIHNDESFYFDQLKKSATSIKEKVYYTLEAPKIKAYSKNVLAKADRLWYISSEEFHRSKHAKKSVFLPVPINDVFQKFNKSNNEKVLFVGSLFMPNNIFALDWYLQNVHDSFLHRDKYELVIVGAVKSEAEKQKIINKYAKFKKVTLHFNQMDLAPFYRQSKVFINPMFHGSGVKIKSIMALVNALPLVSTTVGAEGIGLTSDMFWIANNDESFLLALTEIFNSQQEFLESKVNEAQNFLKQNHYLTVLEHEINTL